MGDRQDAILEAIMRIAELDRFRISEEAIARVDFRYLSDEEMNAVELLAGQVFTHRWRLEEVLAEASPAWRVKPGDPVFNQERTRKLKYLFDTLRTGPSR